jgi:hypothetical protein
MKTKPRGGRGKTTSYQVKQVKIPLPILNDVLEVRQRYWDYLAKEGDSDNPPSFLDFNSETNIKPDIPQYSQELINSQLDYLKTIQFQIKEVVNTLPPSQSKDDIIKHLVDLFNHIESILNKLIKR